MKDKIISAFKKTIKRAHSYDQFEYDTNDNNSNITRIHIDGFILSYVDGAASKVSSIVFKSFRERISLDEHSELSKLANAKYKELEIEEQEKHLKELDHINQN